MKVIGIGLNKTGTTTLGACLKHWGYRHISFSAEAFDMWVEKDTVGLLSFAEKFDSFEDWPWPLVYPALDRRFPGSKFILTKRSCADVWFSSLCKHADRTGPTRFRRMVYGHAMPHGQSEHHTMIYENHIASVRNYFADRPDDLLEVCWEEGKGWTELATFLGHPIPEMPFPHENRSPS